MYIIVRVSFYTLVSLVMQLKSNYPYFNVNKMLKNVVDSPQNLNSIFINIELMHERMPEILCNSLIINNAYFRNAKMFNTQDSIINICLSIWV